MTLSARTASITHEVNQPLSGTVTNASTCQRMLRDANRAADVIQRLRTLVEQAHSLATSELQGNGVILQTDFEENLPEVSGDRVQLQQVILNLFMNVADAMTTVDGRARNLLVATDRDDSTRVRLSVRDSG